MLTDEEKKERKREAQKRYRNKNKDRVRESHRKWSKANSEREQEIKRKWAEDNQKEYNKKYAHNNKERISKYQKEYREKNKDILSNKAKERNKHRRKTDSFYVISRLIRSRTRKAILNYNISKNNSTLKMLGCDKITLMNHLQSTGELYDQNFNIYDYDSTVYHIDHIKTFADVKNGVYTLEEVCHYTNLQILPAVLNRSKGGTSWNI